MMEIKFYDNDLNKILFALSTCWQAKKKSQEKVYDETHKQLPISKSLTQKNYNCKKGKIN